MTTMMIDLTTVNLTYHAREERIARLTECLNLLGVSETILEVPDYTHHNGRCMRCLTATGMLFIIDKDNNQMVTGYMANVRQVASMYYAMGYDRIPLDVYRVIKNNERMYEYLLWS